MGDNMFDTLTRGDLYVIITVQNDSTLEIHGHNLVSKLEIDSIDAILGTETIVRGLDGREFSIKIPPGTQYGTRLGLQGQGLYQMNTTIRGDLIVDVIVRTPTLSEAQLSVLRNIKSTQ